MAQMGAGENSGMVPALDLAMGDWTPLGHDR
jgi:hypothetical protein